MNFDVLYGHISYRCLWNYFKIRKLKLIFQSFYLSKLCFDEFWFRFDTTLECQQHEELEADNISLHSRPVLCTPWAMEKQASLLYTQKLFNIFQEEVNVARDHCFILQTT
jgi:hypothetical protein